MKKKLLGTSGLNVSEIGMGTMTWGRQNTEQEGHAQIEYALDQGINFFDTAEMYAVPPSPETYGKTETIIGNWFKNSGRRDEVIIASKIVGGGFPWIRDGAHASANSIQVALEGSLKRLHTDHIDLYQVHWPARPQYNFENGFTFDPSEQDRQQVVDHISEMLDVFAQIIKQGKVGHIGVSNETAWGTMTWLDLAAKSGGPRIASIQNEYSLTRREFDLDLAETCLFENVGLIGYSPLASGSLSGKYLEGAMPAGSRGSIVDNWRQTARSEPAFRAYVDLAQKHGLDPSQMAIAFANSRPFMTSVLIGATTMEQLKVNIAASDIVLDEAVLKGIQDIWRQYPRPY